MSPDRRGRSLARFDESVEVVERGRARAGRKNRVDVELRRKNKAEGGHTYRSVHAQIQVSQLV